MIDVRDMMDAGLYKFPDKSNESFGWFQMTEAMFLHILDILPTGKTVLEFGSGWGSTQLAKYYNVYTVEHDSAYIDKYPDLHYIHAPMKKNWYDVEALKTQMPKEYDMIIVDGPVGGGIIHQGKLYTTRSGFNRNIDLFKTDVPIVWDDLHFAPVYNAFVELALKLGKVPNIYVGDVTKSYGVIR